MNYVDANMQVKKCSELVERSVSKARGKLENLAQCLRSLCHNSQFPRSTDRLGPRVIFRKHLLLDPEDIPGALYMRWEQSMDGTPVHRVATAGQIVLSHSSPGTALSWSGLQCFQSQFQKPWLGNTSPSQGTMYTYVHTLILTEKPFTIANLHVFSSCSSTFRCKVLEFLSL